MLGGTYGRRVVVVCGKGNNGADGRVAARRAARLGRPRRRVRRSPTGSTATRFAREHRACRPVRRRDVRHRVPRRARRRRALARRARAAARGRTWSRSTSLGRRRLDRRGARRRRARATRPSLRRAEARACCSNRAGRTRARSTSSTSASTSPGRRCGRDDTSLERAPTLATCARRTRADGHKWTSRRARRRRLGRA